MQPDKFFKTEVGRNYLARLGIPLWVFDIDEGRVVWANEAGLAAWAAESIEELAARDLAADMSPVVAQRLRQYQEDFERQAAEFRESWTLYPKGVPRTLDVVFRGIRLPDGRMGMLCEAPAEVRSTPEALRSAEAVLHTSVCISLLDPEGELLYSNTAARTRYGGSIRSVGERFADARDFHRLLRDVAEHGVFKDSVETVTSSGRRWHHVLASSCFDAVTGRRAILISENDVTEAHAARQALLGARDAAVEASRLKTEFVANVSHEIRTPLNGVLGVTQLLGRTALSDEQRELVETLHASSEALMGIIQGILDVSRIEAGIFDLDESFFAVADVLKEVADTLFGTAFARGVSIAVENEVATNHRFKGDAQRIRQVLINLVGNAVKFSSATPVILRARDIDDERLEFAVIDQGAGISEADQKRIFDRFQQVGEAAPRGPGTGLGLSISRSLVERMGGEIGVVSREGAGSTFWFRLSVARAVHPVSAPAPEPASARGARLEGLRVLVADDNDTNRFIIRRLCELSGMAVTEAHDGQEALTALGVADFDVVLMDVQMPVMSGPEAILRIRKMEGPVGSLPIIVLSADAMEMSIKEVLDLGADAYLTKPIDGAALIARIGQAAARIKESRAGPPRQAKAH